MNEKVPIPQEHERLADDEYRKLAERLSERIEGFPFPGLEETSYLKLKAESDEFPDMATHIDALIVQFKEKGIQVFVEENGNVFILPLGIPPTPKNVFDNSIFPKYLQVSDDMDPDLKKLISARR